MPDKGALQRYESSAERGIIEFAEAMQAIRDQKLYPNAEKDSQTVKAAWKSYCSERWGMSPRSVLEMIQALPVLKRLARGAAARQLPSIDAAAKVATLPEPVQDAILGGSTRDEARTKAKAVRQLVKRVELAENRTPTVEEQIAEAEAVKPAPKKPKRKSKRDSKFAKALGDALHFAQVAADHIQTNPIDDVDNDWAWNRIEYLRHQVDRIAEKLYKPRHVRDLNDDFAELLGGGES